MKEREKKGDKYQRKRERGMIKEREKEEKRRDEDGASVARIVDDQGNPG